MPGPPPKPAARRQRGRRRNDFGLVRAASKPPTMPRGLCRQAQDAWSGYWTDVVSGVMRRSDAPIVLRWIKNLDRYHRLIGEADKSPLVVGSAGQLRASPLYDLAFRIETSIRCDEQQLGIGPLNRLRLGVALGESAKSLAELNAEAEDDAEGDDDIRVALISSARTPKDG